MASANPDWSGAIGFGVAYKGHVSIVHISPSVNAKTTPGEG